MVSSLTELTFLGFVVLPDSEIVKGVECEEEEEWVE